MLADADGFLDVLFHVEPFKGDTIAGQFTTEPTDLTFAQFG